MASGYGSNYADVIDFESVKELCPAEAAALTATLEKYGVGEQALAECFMWDEPQTDNIENDILDESQAKQGLAEITEAYEALQAAFIKATTVGNSHLTLGIGYHDEDSGDRYDEVSGVYWTVADGMYVLSPAGKKFRDKVERQFFVTFG
jgi:hypothetical protein